MLIHPALVFIAGALLLPFFKTRLLKQIFLLIVSTLGFLFLFVLPEGTYWTYSFLGQNLVLGRIDSLSQCFGYIFLLMAILGVIYALHLRDTVQQVAAFLHVAGAIGMVLAGDLISLWIFWEIMSMAAVFLIWAERSKKALRAGFRYIFIHLFGGSCLLAGIIIHFHATGSIAFDSLSGQGLSSYLILLGFLINAAVPPLSAWLSDAYPEATITGSVFLTAYASKGAIYALIRGFAGFEPLIWLGVIMAIYGVVFAVLENDIRRLLAYHIISQVGYMVCAVGLGSDMALNGATAHAFCHILYKALLFMGVGAVIYATGRRKLSELQGQGLARLMPWVLILYMIGAFSISGVPLFNGFISKSITISAAAVQGRPTIELLLILASIGTFLHTGLKLPYFIWFGKTGKTNQAPNTPIKVTKLPRNMFWAMGLTGGLCILFGCFPGILYRILPYPLDYHPYTPDHIISSLQLLVMTAVAFFLLLSHLKGKATVTLDTDWFYRKFAQMLIWFVGVPLSGLRTRLQSAVGASVNYLSLIGKNPWALKQILLGRGASITDYDTDVSRTAIGWSALAGLVLLFFYVILLYFR
ncbi:Na(+)/H(+) antiporter subunit D [Planctomycetota bacterium]